MALHQASHVRLTGALTPRRSLSYRQQLLLWHHRQSAAARAENLRRIRRVAVASGLA